MASWQIGESKGRYNIRFIIGNPSTVFAFYVTRNRDGSQLQTKSGSSVVLCS